MKLENLLPYGVEIYDETNGSSYTLDSDNLLMTTYNAETYKDTKVVLKPISDIKEDAELIGYMNRVGVDWMGVTKDNVMNLPFKVVDKFLKNHYDVFDMIGSGSAISIHELYN